MNRALVYIPAPQKLGVAVHPVIPAREKWKQEDQLFKVILRYVVSLRLARATCVLWSWGGHGGAMETADFGDGKLALLLLTPASEDRYQLPVL